MTRSIATALALVAMLAAPAAADTLREALVSTYRANPGLNAQRQSLKATDSNVAIARAAGRPQLSATVGINRDLTQTGILVTGGKGPTASVSGQLSYPLFNGGGVRNSVKAAEARDEAGRYTLKAVEGDTFVEAVTVYMDVIRDRSIVDLNQNNVDVLGTNLSATQDRYKIGDLTRTDVAQSQARLELGRSQLVSARGRLTASEENYRRVVGHQPGVLAQPPALPPLPQNPDEAVKIALVYNPDIIAIVRQARAAGYDVNVARASRLPSLQAQATGSYVNNLAGNSPPGFPSAGTQTSIGLGLNLPLYQGGLPAARIRQAQALQGQVLEQSIGTERAVIATARSAFATYQAALSAIASNQIAVNANTLALEGARAERTVGTRTVLDVLNAEQELLNAQVQLVSARHDAYVAGFQMLNAMGQAQADQLGLDGGPLYDPLGNYRHVAHNLNDWASDPSPVAQSTRTVMPSEVPAAGSALPQGVTGPKR